MLWMSAPLTLYLGGGEAEIQLRFDRRHRSSNLNYSGYQDKRLGKAAAAKFQTADKASRAAAAKNLYKAVADAAATIPFALRTTRCSPIGAPTHPFTSKIYFIMSQNGI